MQKISNLCFPTAHANQFITLVNQKKTLSIILYIIEERDTFFQGLSENFLIKIMGIEVIS